MRTGSATSSCPKIITGSIGTSLFEVPEMQHRVQSLLLHDENMLVDRCIAIILIKGARFFVSLSLFGDAPSHIFSMATLVGHLEQSEWMFSFLRISDTNNVQC